MLDTVMSPTETNTLISTEQADELEQLFKRDVECNSEDGHVCQKKALYRNVMLCGHTPRLWCQGRLELFHEQVARGVHHMHCGEKCIDCFTISPL